LHPYIQEATKNLTEDEMVEFTKKFSKVSKKDYKAYSHFLTWGFLGGHRFYLGQYWQGTVMLVLTIMTMGFCGVIGIMDFPNIPNAVEKANKKKVLKIIKEVKRG